VAVRRFAAAAAPYCEFNGTGPLGLRLSGLVSFALFGTDDLTEAPKPPLKVWAVSDGRAGIEAQVVGLSEALARLVPCEVTVKRVAWKGRTGRLPWWLNLLPKRWLTPESGIPTGKNEEWPDLWIAAGRATLPLSIRARRWSGGKTCVVQIQDPRVPAHMFDLVIPPKHDRMVGDNIVAITGSPHRVTPQRLAAEYEVFKDLIDPLPHPRVAVLVGGKSKAFDLSSERAAQIAHSIQIPLEQDGGSLLMTFSRRTPDAARALMAARLRHLPGMVWNGEGPNPYFAFLAAADYILVTEDSTNMATEAASTGKPVFVLKLDGSSLKFRLFHEELESLGAARPYGGAFHGWTYAPVNETDRAARAVLEKIGVDIPEPPAEFAAVEESPKPKRRPRAKSVEVGPKTPAPKPRKPRTPKPKP